MKTVITNRQGMGLIVLMISETMVLGCAQEAKSDIWISILLALGIGLLLVSMYSWILLQYPGKNLYDILLAILGKWLGSAITLLYILYSFYVGAYVLINFVVFTNTVGLVGTPNIIIASMVIFLVIAALKRGIEVMGRWSEFFVKFILLMSFIAVIFMFPMIQVNNLKPILADGWQPVLEGAYTTATFPFAEIVIFMIIFNTKIVRKEKSIYTILVGGLIIGGILVFMTNVISFVELGQFAYSTSYFPIYAAVSRISIDDIFQRIEIVIAVAFIMGGFMKVALYALAGCEGIKKIMKVNDYKFMVTPICILVLIVALTMFDDVMDSITELTYYNYIAVLMQGIIPVMIVIISVIRLKIIKNSS